MLAALAIACGGKATAASDVGPGAPGQPGMVATEPRNAAAEAEEPANGALVPEVQSTRIRLTAVLGELDAESQATICNAGTRATAASTVGPNVPSCEQISRTCWP